MSAWSQRKGDRPGARVTRTGAVLDGSLGWLCLGGHLAPGLVQRGTGVCPKAKFAFAVGGPCS